MKHILIFLLLIISFIGCKQGETNTEKTPPTYRQTPVQNVNGNMPDTTNSIDLQTHEKPDNTKVTDTSHR